MGDLVGENDPKLHEMSSTAMVVFSVETISAEVISVEATSEVSQEL